jgi:hypothetical protein
VTLCNLFVQLVSDDRSTNHPHFESPPLEGLSNFVSFTWRRTHFRICAQMKKVDTPPRVALQSLHDIYQELSGLCHTYAHHGGPYSCTYCDQYADHAVYVRAPFAKVALYFFPKPPLWNLGLMKDVRGLSRRIPDTTRQTISSFRNGLGGTYHTEGVEPPPGREILLLRNKWTYILPKPPYTT